jgi:twitching motility protein PilT
VAELDKFFAALHKHGGSDLHLSSGAQPVMRLHGSMTQMKVPALPPQQIQQMLEEIMSQRTRSEFADTGDADFSYELPGVARFRCNAFVDRAGPGAVFRIIPTEILTVEQLGLSPAIINLCSLHKGLVLVTGPTGSGKSTTLAAMVDHVNKSRKDHIITIEDPIEFVHEHHRCLVNQREVHDHTESFAKALRAALREDPDIVLVGEMRDLETTHIAIETAETGHLVFGTLHTTTAASTVDRIIGQFPADRQAQIRTMLAASLKGVVAQTLCKKRDGKGRVAAMELLVVTSAIANLIREGKTYQIPSAMQTGAKVGMTLLNDALIKLVMDDKIEADEALAKSVDRKDMAQKLQVAGIDADDAEDE